MADHERGSDEEHAGAPTAPHFAVPRERLLQRLDDATQRRLTILVGPAGSGKSVLLAQWAAHRDEPSVAWLSITDADQHQPTLGRRLQAALSRLEPTSGPLGVHVTHHASELRRLAATRAGILVIEDLDRVLSPALTREVADLIEGAPDSLRFVVTARVDAVLPLHRLRLRDEVTEIRQADLAFDVSEARPLLTTLARQPVTPEQAAVLVSRTEGWAAGLQLAALSLRDRDDVTAFVEEFSGDDRHVADFLGSEVLAQLPEHVRQFLLETSVLDAVTPPLCELLTGKDEATATALLASLSRQGLFVAPLDEARTIYRYHRLFRDLLRLQLRMEHPGLEERLLRTTGEWHRDRGESDAAADCFIAARAWNDLVALAMGFGRTGTAQLRRTSIIRWFSALPDAERWANPDIALLYAAVLVFAGNALAAEQVLAEIPDRFTLTPGQRAVSLALTAFLEQWHLPLPRVIEASEGCLRALDASGGVVPNIAGLSAPGDIRYAMRVCIGRGHLHAGDVAAAIEWLRPLTTDASGVHLLFVVHGLGAAAVAEAGFGNLGAAERFGRQALEAAEAGGMEADPGGTDAYLALAMVARERNHIEQAVSLLDEARARAEQNRRHTQLWAIDAERALLCLSQGQPEHGLRVLREARSVGRPPPPDGVAARLRAAGGLLMLATLDPGGAEHALGGSNPDHVDAATPVRVLIEVEHGDVPSARKQLDAWPRGGTLRNEIDRAVLTAVVEDLDGETRVARSAIAEAVELAEIDGHVRAFSDIGANALRLVRRLYRSTPTSYLRELVEARSSRAGVVDVAGALTQQLSDRELAVLRHLPSDLSNPQIADQLYISVNTLKTHLGHIYQKLGVTNRRDAVERADLLHLL